MSDTKRILVIEEDLRASEYLMDLLGYFGYVGESVSSCSGAFRVLRDRHFDALLLNRWVEDGPGDRVLEWLQNQQRDESVIVMDQMADYDQLVDLVNRGATDLIPIPVEPAHLKRSLEIAVGEKVKG